MEETGDSEELSNLRKAEPRWGTEAEVNGYPPGIRMPFQTVKLLLRSGCPPKTSMSQLS